MIWKEKERSIKAVQMDNLRGSLGIRKVEKVPNALTKESGGVTKELMKMFFCGSDMWRGWRMIGLPRGSP